MKKFFIHHSSFIILHWRHFCAAGLLLCTLSALACRQDMADQPRYDPLEPSTFFADGQSARPLVPGTVARGRLVDEASLFAAKAGEAFVDTFPLPVTGEVLSRGQERYNIFCAPCHSRTGDGDGMIVRRGFRRPPSFHSDRLRESPVGYFFDVITNGFGAMPDYAAQIPVRDRWAVIAYTRALQLSQHATLADVPANEQLK
ncbi:MAG: c-type cytochrome [Candidatus Binatia bacterium]